MRIHQRSGAAKKKIGHTLSMQKTQVLNKQQFTSTWFFPGSVYAMLIEFRNGFHTQDLPYELPHVSP